MTQFEMITSTVFEGSGIDSMCPLRNSTFVAPAFSLFSSASASISSVMSTPYALPVGPTRFAERSTSMPPPEPSRARSRLRAARRVPWDCRSRATRAALRRESGGLAGFVEIRGDRIPRLVCAAAAAARTRAATRHFRRAIGDALCDRAVAFLHCIAKGVDRVGDAVGLVAFIEFSSNQKKLMYWPKRKTVLATTCRGFERQAARRDGFNSARSRRFHRTCRD